MPLVDVKRKWILAFVVLEAITIGFFLYAVLTSKHR